MPSQMEIARLANVSQSVVSRALTGRAKDFGIADETVARVRRIAEAMNYQPNQAAHILRGRQTKLIGVIVRWFKDPFLAIVLEELNKRALQAGYTLLVVGFERGEFNAGEIRVLQTYRPDAFIVIGSTDFRRWDEAFLRSGKLIFQIGMPVEDPRIISCGIDEAEAARLLVEHLAQLGHRSFGIVGDSSAPSRMRAGHLKRILQERKLQISLPCVHLSEQEFTAAGVDAGNYFLHDSVRASWPTAVIATGDMVALPFIRRLGDAGIAVPGQLSVASYSDIEFAALVRPALTTIRIPVSSLAAAGMDVVTGMQPRVSVLLPPVLKVRESTAAPAKG